MSLTTDKRFILLEDGKWDLREKHTSDKVIVVSEEDDDSLDETDEELDDNAENDENDESNYDDVDNDDFDDSDDDLKDLVIMDEDELELEQ